MENDELWIGGLDLTYKDRYKKHVIVTNEGSYKSMWASFTQCMDLSKGVCYFSAYSEEAYGNNNKAFRIGQENHVL